MIEVESSIYCKIAASVKKEIDYSILLKSAHPNEQEILVHEFRKIIKRIRAIIRLIRSSIGEVKYHEIDSDLSYIASLISDSRDATVNIRTLLNINVYSKEQLPEELKSIAIKELKKKYIHAYSNIGKTFSDTIERVCLLLLSFYNKLENIQLDEISSGQLFNSISKSYYKSARLYYDAYSSLDTEVIHKWRKFNKHFLLQLKYSPIDIEMNKHFIDQLHKLTDILGMEHDYAELEKNLWKILEFSEEDLRTFHRIIDNLRLKLQKMAFDIGKKLYSGPVNLFSKELSTL